MQIESKDKAIELLYRALPYSGQITNLDTTKYPTAIKFTWRGNDYKLETNTGGVDRINGGVLEGTDTAILIRELLKREQLK